METTSVHFAPLASRVKRSHRGVRPWRALGTVRRLEFETPEYQFLSAPFSGDAPVLEGRVQELQLQAGLWLHCAEVLDLHSMASRVMLDAGLRLVIVLAGDLDVSIGGQRLQLSSDQPGQASAALVAMPEAAMFERRWQRGKWERKLSLHLTTEWLRVHADICGALTPDPGTGLCRLLSGCESPAGLRMLTWKPSSHAVSLAEQLILDADESAADLLRLRQAGRALELLYEALAQCQAPQAPVSTGLRARDQERMLRLRSFLDDEAQAPYEVPLTIEELGRRFGLSASTLQRQFRLAFSCSVNEYRRNIRLQQARADLEGGSTIAEAAERAGYTSAANFSTAFRRHFGASPRDFCPRC